MKPTLALLRGAKGYSWYKNYLKGGQDAFKKHISPTPFDWKSGNQKRPSAFFSIKMDNDDIGDLVFELASDIVPQTVDNFMRLCEGNGLKYPGYTGTKIHLVRKGDLIVGGDIVNGDGTGNHSSFSGRHFPDENYIIPHTQRGLISMVTTGIDTNGSQFYVSLGVAKQLNGRSVVFGRMIEGESVLKAIEEVFTVRGVPARNITIHSCGLR